VSKQMPYIKFYGRDWLGDHLLRIVPPEVRGVWIDLLAAMSMAEPYGHLAVNGRPMEDAHAARLVGIPLADYLAALAQIEGNGIASRTPEGVLYSRRLVREHATYTAASDYGRRGGNPILTPHTPLEDEEETNSQKPEARSHTTLKGLANPPLKGRVKGSLKGVELPFQSEAFKAAWQAWREYRKTIRRPMTARAEEIILTKLPGVEATAIAWIDNALAQGWQGIYEPRQDKSSTRPPAPSSATPQRGIQEIITARRI
jgi:hypothetical protein